MTKREGRLWNNLTDVFQSANYYKHITPGANQVLYAMADKGLIERQRAGYIWLYRLPQPVKRR